MPPDLEPASALAKRIETDCVEDYGAESGQGSCCGFRRVLAEQLIEADRAAVRESLERRVRELETLVCDEREVILRQRKALDGLETDLTQIRDYLPTDWTNETVRGGEAMLVVKKKWDECRAQDERIASLEAQLASARELRPAVLWFAQQMELKLRENDHKGGWHGDKPRALIKRIGQELKELRECEADTALPNCGCREASCPHMPFFRPNEADVVSEAADVANMAMMVADYYREGGPSEDSGRSGFASLTSPASQKEPL